MKVKAVVVEVIVHMVDIVLILSDSKTMMSGLRVALFLSIFSCERLERRCTFSERL